MPRLGRCSFPELSEQPLLPHKLTKNVQCKPNLDRAHRLSRRSLCCLAQHLKRQSGERVAVGAASGTLVAIGQG